MHYDHSDEIYLEARRLRSQFVADTFKWIFRSIKRSIQIRWMRLKTA